MGDIEFLILLLGAAVALSIFVTVITAYASYVIGEELHVSGVLAAVASGIYSGWNAHAAMDAGTRLSGVAFWGVMLLGLEALLFVLLGCRRRNWPRRSTSGRSRCRRWRSPAR